jgi:DNA-binding NtrC family response regulator
MSLSSPTGSSAILVADNDVFARNLLIRELSRDGYFVLGAANCEEAIALSASFAGEISLFLSNSDLPGRRGLTERILRERPRTRVVTISARTQADLIERSHARGALPDALSAELRRALTAGEFFGTTEV